MKILNVAEKPSVARSISSILSSSFRSSKSSCKYTPNLTFKYKDHQMTFTSVIGHLFNLDFVDSKNWNACDPKDLFQCEIVSNLVDHNKEIAQNLKTLSASHKLVIIWTDCDREGENIGKEIFTVIRTVSQMDIKRARFNAINKRQIEYAFNNLSELDWLSSNSVDARIELDLRIGCAFTRLLTLNMCTKGMVLSYGSCQMPTLGFVVYRMLEKENFKAETFYLLKANIQKKKLDVFNWVRSRVFDRNCLIHVFNYLNKFSYFTITNTVKKNTEKTKPCPLRTVELQKKCASIFRLSSHRVMEIAESLYVKGYISYPRTETDIFPKNFDHNETVALLKQGAYAEYCDKLIQSGIQNPRMGKNNDLAHSPIYPLKAGHGLERDDFKIYDFVARRYLGCVSRNAKGIESTVIGKIGNEEFELKGLSVVELNYLEIYIFDKWEEKKVNEYKNGEKIKIIDEDDVNKKDDRNKKKEIVVNNKPENKLEKNTFNPSHYVYLFIDEGQTTPPEYLTEPDLIALMDKNGIGTDATIAEHIKKIQDRKYIYMQNKKYFIASALGLGLFYGFKDLDLECLVKSFLRRDLEISLKRVCEGKLEKENLVSKEIETYIKFFDVVQLNIGKMKKWMETMKANFKNDDGSDDDNNGDDVPKKKKKVNKYDKKKDTIRKEKGASKRKIKNITKNNNDSTDGSDNDNGNDFIVLEKKSKKTYDNNKVINKKGVLRQKNNLNDDIEIIFEEKLKKKKNDFTVQNKENFEPNECKKDKKSNIKVLLCNCNKEARECTVNKKGKNCGKKFYSCFFWPNKCDFFCWSEQKDLLPVDKPKYKEEVIDVMCYCGYETQIKVANTEKNRGKKFYCCKKEYKKCKYFEWVDKDDGDN